MTAQGKEILLLEDRQTILPFVGFLSICLPNLILHLLKEAEIAFWLVNEI